MAASEDRHGAAIALGANLPSAYGSALDTLLAVRPLLQQLLSRMAPEPLQLQWSPLFRTAPVGGPTDQPDYLNAVVLVSGLGAADTRAAEALMEALLALEQRHPACPITLIPGITAVAAAAAAGRWPLALQQESLLIRPTPEAPAAIEHNPTAAPAAKYTRLPEL